ncbi:RDD family protein [Streptosporangium sp. NPDC002721]|uniref:RDD family protein n=1 Tax=Streptosporangium sp. NPDC002721 TaxID=3366188 RepID=UPI0036C3CA15
MSDVVTGEAVVVEVRVAQLPSRAAALLIDMTVQVLTLLGASLLVGSLGFLDDPALTAMVYIVLSVLVIVGYPVAFETLSRGRSLGKLALGLRVVSDDGGPERFRQALFRGLAGVLEFWMLSGAPALISSLISEKGKRLGDLFSGTMVIAERVPRQYGPPLDMPPSLAPWAATLELSRLPEQVAATARQYLMRWHDLAPAVQHEMGVRIATEMSAFVSPPAPPGVPPFAYLTAVLAERRRREQARLAQQWHDRQRSGEPWAGGQWAGEQYPGGQHPGAPRPGGQWAPAPQPGAQWASAQQPDAQRPGEQQAGGQWAGQGGPDQGQTGQGQTGQGWPDQGRTGHSGPRPHAQPAPRPPQPRIPLPPPAEPTRPAYPVHPVHPVAPPPPADRPAAREPGPTPGGFVPPA